MMKATYDFSQGTRSALEPMTPGKTRITISIDDDILSGFAGRCMQQAAATTRR